MIKLVCFDLDGVLLDSTEWHYRSFNDALSYHTKGWIITPENHESTFNGLPTLKKLDLLVKQGIIKPDQVEPVAELKSRYFKDIVRNEMEPDIHKIEMMQRVRGQGIKVAVVSNCNKGNIQLLLYKLQLLDDIDLWVSAEDVENPKPSPDGYLRAMAEFNVGCGETLIFEDSKVGLDAAYSSGAHVVEVAGAEDITTLFVTSHISLANRGTPSIS